MKNRNNNQNKFCKFHNSKTHNISECRSYKKKNASKENQDNSNTKSFTISEPRPKPSTIEIPMKIFNNNYKALVDTGSVENYLPENILNDEQIKTYELNPKIITEVANGSRVEINRFTNLKFNLFFR
ncbi:hypothetical protein DMUE_5796 [Dictyocoela muelleri]|nr:hypothetical protein DMUE_5796 [Dictyocoela muelleri]